jgi:hypothetical protein
MRFLKKQKDRTASKGDDLMSGGAAAGAASVAYMAAVANAIKACGTLVRVHPQEFEKILARSERPLVVRTEGGLFSASYKYLTGYRGLAFFCKSKTELELPGDTELINANKIVMPEL